MVFTTSIDKKNSIMMLEPFLIFSSPWFESKKKFKLVSNILGIENKTSPQKPSLLNLPIDRAKLHVNIPT